MSRVLIFFYSIFILASHPTFSMKDHFQQKFSQQSIGNVISVLGLIRNKVLEENKPLYTDFSGGEWVIIPLPHKDNYLCAAIFHEFTPGNVNNCDLITHASCSLEKEETRFNVISMPLTALYLFRGHFTFDRYQKPQEYIGPVEQDLNQECFHWLEDNPPQRIMRPRAAFRSRNSAPFLPAVSPFHATATDKDKELPQATLASSTRDTDKNHYEILGSQ